MIVHFFLFGSTELLSGKYILYIKSKSLALVKSSVAQCAALPQSALAQTSGIMHASNN